jgi:hypothetical protein
MRSIKTYKQFINESNQDSQDYENYEDIEISGFFYGSLIKYDIGDFVNLVKAEFGWAVAEQAEDIISGQNFNEQNVNALKYIMGFAKSKGETELADDIKEYLDRCNEIKR